ncbi:MAG: hypothetical protein ACRD2S_02260 [Terriglobales bacterium]
MTRKSEKVGRSMVVAATIFSFLLFLAAPLQSHGDDDRDKCRHRIERAEARLNTAVQRHGERSPQAEARRRDLNAERDRCWNRYHSWWNGRDNQWHTERDWDNDHHDHDDHDNH